MNPRITELLDEIRRCEEELEEVIKTHEADFFYRFEGAKVKFEKSIELAHRELRIGIITWLLKSSFRNIASAPIVYPMIIPLFFLDISVTIYQAICFPLYKITKVDRGKYIVVDRHQLIYLNAIEKLHCIYCGYANGLIAYSREIIARTEQYWCPIKHAKKVLDSHRRYAQFADFGESNNYHEHLARMRNLMTRKN